MSQHIGSQQGGVFYNAGRDQQIVGNHAVAVSTNSVTREILLAAADLRAALSQAGLPEPLQARARDEMAAVDEALSAQETDQPRIASALQRLTGVLLAAGPLATAAAELVNPLQVLVKWLGPAGQSLMQLLPMLR